MSNAQRFPVDVLVVTALEEERDAFLAYLDTHRQMPASTDDVRVYHYAELHAEMSDGTPVVYKVALSCVAGMGRLKAASATSDAIRAWTPTYVMLVGIAGGIVGEVSLGDILVADQVADYEVQKVYPGKKAPSVRWEINRADPRLLAFAAAFTDDGWTTEVREARPVIGECKRHIGTVATGDKVVTADKLLRTYKEIWPKLIGVEMEAGGVALAAFESIHKPGFFMVRCVSDLAGNKDEPDVTKWRTHACHAAAAYAIALLKRGPIPRTISPALIVRRDVSLSTLRDMLQETQPEISYVEIETVLGFVMDTVKVEPSTSDFTDTEPEAKLVLNGLSHEVRDLLTQGFRKAQLVKGYVQHTATMHPNFPARLASGFKSRFQSDEARGLRGDALFHSLLEFASNRSSDLRRQLAALSVLTYLFGICEVFKK